MSGGVLSCHHTGISLPLDISGFQTPPGFSFQSFNNIIGDGIRLVLCSCFIIP